MAITESKHNRSSELSQQLCSCVQESVPVELRPQIRYSKNVCGVHLEGRRAALYWLYHMKNHARIYIDCDDDHMEQIKKLAPEGIEIKSRPQPRRGFALRTPIYFDVYSKDEIIGLGNVFAFIYPLRGRRSASNQGDRIWRTNSEKEEISQEEEGAKTLVFVNRYERSRINRKKCIEHYGTSCSVCGFSFFDYYGKLGEDYIHVHHLGGLANLQGKVKRFDPIADLCTVCPNCHEMLHKVNPPMKIDDLKHIIKSVSARLKPYPFKTDH